MQKMFTTLLNVTIKTSSFFVDIYNFQVYNSITINFFKIKFTNKKNVTSYVQIHKTDGSVQLVNI